MSIIPLILKSFLNKHVWFKYPKSLIERIYVILVAAARVPVSYQLHIDSVVAAFELFHCYPVVTVALVDWSWHYFFAAP